MPLLFKRPVGEGFLAVWRRDESTAQLLDLVVLSPAETSFYKTIAGQPRRRKEWLTWHRMIRDFLGKNVHTDYDPMGSPVLIGHPGHISVSHSKELVVLYYQPERCGVDIEDCGRDFERVSDRYISPEEWKLPGASRTNRFQALIWCAKETAYKYAGKEGLELTGDIRMVWLDTVASQADVRLSDGRTIGLGYEFLEGHCLAYTRP